MNRKEKLDIAISLLKMAREQLELNFSEFNTARFVDEIKEARRTQGHVRPIVKPDLDNYIKSTLDALNGVIWTDDATIVELNTSKWYADDPRIEIEVKELKNDEERNQN